MPTIFPNMAPKIFGILLLLLIGFGGLQALASAQESEPAVEYESILGTLTALDDSDDRVPVPDIRIRVFLENTLVGEGVSDPEGAWEVEVPGPDTYRVQIDTSTFPEGLGLSNPEQAELDDINVRAGQQKRIIFRLGAELSSGISRVERISNLFLAGLRLGIILAMAAAGLSLVFSVTKLVNFAHGEIITMGALIAWFFNSSTGGPGLHLLIAIIPAIICVATFSAGMEVGIWAPLRKRNTSDLTLMIISIGASLVLRYLYLIIFEAQVRSYSDYSVQKAFNFLSFTTTPKTLFIIGTGIGIISALAVSLLFTKQGTAIRALSNNPDLAKASGINVDQTTQVAWIVGAAITALSGIFLGITQGVEWEMGWQFLLLVFAAFILGGTGNIFGAMFGGILVGLFIEMSTYWIGSEFKVAIGLALMALTLLIRPQGVLGWRMRTA